MCSSDLFPSHDRPDRRTNTGSRYDGTDRAVTPTAKTYTGDGLLKVVIPKNAKVQIYFENAYIDEETNENNILWGVNNRELCDLTNKV